MAIARDIITLRNRLDRLEEQVRRLCEHLGVPYHDGTAGVPPEVIELVRADKRMEAIQRYVELTGADIATARDVVGQL